MTLLLTLVTHAYTIQASDRRLTYPDGSAAEELANKATLLCQFASFAYTGLARASRTETTDELIMRSLSPQNLNMTALVENLRKELSKAMRQVPIRGTAAERRVLRRTSVIGGGFLGLREPSEFGRQPVDDDLHPFLVAVSNAQGLDGNWKFEADQDFSVELAFLGLGDAFRLHEAGQKLESCERIELERDIRQCLRRRLRPEAAARLLARAIRKVSRRNSLVGPNVMCTLIHRSLVGRTRTGFSSGMVPLLSELQRESEYFKSNGSQLSSWIYSPDESNRLIHYGPNAVCRGAMMKGLMLEPAGATSMPQP